MNLVVVLPWITTLWRYEDHTVVNDRMSDYYLPKLKKLEINNRVRRQRAASQPVPQQPADGAAPVLEKKPTGVGRDKSAEIPIRAAVDL